MRHHTASSVVARRSWCCVLFALGVLTALLFAAGLEPISFDRISEVGLDLPHNR